MRKCTIENITQLILNTLKHFEFCLDQLLLFVSEAAATMLSVGQLLKKLCEIVTYTWWHKLFVDLHALITSTKAVFLKSSKSVPDFHRLCFDIRELPQAILTRWETSLQAAFCYN